MASSNRHWPSLFRSKPHQWQLDAAPAACQKTPYAAGVGEGEERSPEPKPRWNPKQEQIRILEAIFDSGMVNPPRDEIRRIRARLQEYGQVGDANVFYWFQNRKSRSKHKQRRHLGSAPRQQPPRAPAPVAPPAATSSSSSSSERSTGSDKAKIVLPPLAPVNQTDHTNYFQSFLVENVCGSNLSTELPQDFDGLVPGLWTELMMGVKSSSEGSALELGKINGNTVMEQNPNPNPNSSTAASAASAAAAPVEIQGGVGGGAARSTVYFNGVGFDVVAGQFINVREVFGESAVLIHASGHPVLTDEWGRTLHPLQHGASYFLI